MARAKQRVRANPLEQKDLFRPDPKLHPPCVAQDARMAMDDDLQSTMSWAQNAIASPYAEGVTFLGYPYLAQLSQRAEYRRASEIFATEMTRKWIKLQSVSQDDDKTDRIAEVN